MKTKCSLLIYNKAIGYVGFKCYKYLWRVKANLYCMSFNRAMKTL